MTQSGTRNFKSSRKKSGKNEFGYEPVSIEALQVESLFGTNDQDSKGLKDPFDGIVGDGEGDAVCPPIDFLFWAKQLEVSTSLRSVIESKTQNTVGSPWVINPLEDALVNANPEKIATETKKIKSLLRSPNRKMSFIEVMKRVVTDEESTGNGYLEVGRDRDNNINFIGHVPSHTIRVRRGNKKGFVQVRGIQKRYYKEFGDPRVMHMETGDFGSRVGLINKANELIHFLIYTPRDSYYGLPRHVAAGAAIRGNSLAQLYNVCFFQNNATPRIIITVSGGSIDPTSMDTIRDFFSAAKGPKAAGRSLILQGGKKTQRNGNDSKIEIHKVSVGETDDASFLEYQKFNSSEIREAHRISGVLTGQIDNIPKTNALLARQITNEQVFKPFKREIEFIINECILNDVIGPDRVVKFEYEDIPAIDPITKSRVDRTYAGIGGLTIDDIRDIKGLKRFNNEWSKLPPNFAFEKFKIDMGVSEGNAQGGKERNNSPRTRQNEPQEE